MFLSYDYEELLQELLSDLTEFGFNEEDTIYIVRGEERFGYRPIIDYFLRKEHIEKDDINNVEKRKAIDVVNEMKEMDKIIR